MNLTTEEYIARLKAGLATLETALYEAKMSAQEVNTKKNKRIAEQQAEIEAGIELIKKYQEERDDFHEHTKHWALKCKELQNELNLYKLEDDDSKTVCHACASGPTGA